MDKKYGYLRLAAADALVGEAVSLLICTFIGGADVLDMIMPLLLLIAFGALYFVLGLVPLTARKKWLKALILAAFAVGAAAWLILS